MIQSKELSLKSIIQSSGGTHFTSYLSNTGNSFELKKQIRESIDVAREHLSDVMEEEDLHRFLQPLEQLLNDSDILNSFKSNVGIFRTKDSFRMLSLPIAVDHLCVVSTSFHVKPLLKWIQADKEFILVGIDKNAASMYVGSQNTFNHVDTLVFTAPNEINAKQQSFKIDAITSWLNETLLETTKKNKAKLFFAGDIEFVKQLSAKVQYSKLSKKPVVDYFSHDNLLEASSAARAVLKDEEQLKLNKTMVEFYWAEDMNLGKTNIFQISRAAVQGRVRKLIIADGVQIFGKIDKQTGGLSINPAHLDHEDDDLLDDIAQAVLAAGGEVIIVPKGHIPKGRPLLAILKKSSKNPRFFSSPQVFETTRNFA